MKLEDLLSNRSLSNVIQDFSDLSEDELKIYINSRIYGEENLSDSEMQLLESGTAKIKTKHGKPLRDKDKFPEFNPAKDDPEEWLRKRITWNANKC